MARILITGGGGFLGSHLGEELLGLGNEVICLDNFFTGDKKNVRHLADHTGFEIIRHDVVEPILLEVDRIFNLACPASPVHYQENPVKTVKTCVVGTLNMLGLAKRVNARILQASTSEIYGSPLEHPQSEDYWGNVDPIGLRSCYDEGKRVAETLMMDYHRQNQVDICIVRIFNTFGPRMAFNDGRVVSNLVLQALKGLPLTVYGDGSQTRSFCYISDMIRAMVAAMERPGFTGPVNLGNPEEVSILELAETIIKLTGSSSKIIYKPLPAGDPVRRRPDIGKAKRDLGWSPQVNLEEGLIATIEDFRARLDKLPSQ